MDVTALQTTQPWPASPEASPGVVGPYKLLQKIGEGGFGEVWMAEQHHPVKRRVALKIIKLGMDTKQVVARFEAERQALALMDHPNIAKVFDGGATDNGRPYFVMELVKGVPITEYCDTNNVSTEDRLKLFIQVCQAIQHAHQKGIIHRDIKPSNILVTMVDALAVPKVIDFGIAKATQQDLTDKTLFTQLEQFIGTPAYMSPEQAEMTSIDIDTRSDIYSLGVLLYELLTGRTPFDSRELLSAGIEQMRRIIRETDPVRPSTKLSSLDAETLTTAARRRHSDPPRLIHLLKGDLDWIVMKCLEKDRTRRYETANGLAMDIQRHLADEPIVARPPTLAYSIQKFVRRNQIFAIAATAVALALVSGVALAGIGLMKARTERNRAVQAQKSEEQQKENALAARRSEEDLRLKAQQQERSARQRAYASDMNLVQQAIQMNNIGRALTTLNQWVPQGGQDDLRGWEWRYFWQFCQSDAQQILAQTGEPIFALSLSKDGRYAAIIGYFSRQVLVWDFHAGREVEGIASGLKAMRLTFCGGSRLAIATTDPESAVIFWDVDRRTLVARHDTPTQAHQMAASADGAFLASISFDSDGTAVLRTWDPANAALTQERNIGRAWIGAMEDLLDVSPDRQWIAYSLGKEVRVVNSSTFEPKLLIAATAATLTSIRFSPDGRWLATGDGYADGNIRLWSTETSLEVARLSGHRAWVGQVVFSKDSRTLISASADQTIGVWDLPEGKLRGVLRGNQHEVWRVALFPGDGLRVITAAKDGLLAIWDASSTRDQGFALTLPQRTLAAAFSADTSNVITVDDKRVVSKWIKPYTSAPKHIMDVPPGFRSPVLSGDGRYLSVHSGAEGIRIYKTETGDLIRQIPDPASWAGVFINGRLWTVREGSETIEFLWEPRQDGNVITWTNLPGHRSRTISDDGRWVLSVDAERNAAVRDLHTGDITTARLNFNYAVFDASFTPDNAAFAIASEPGSASFWRRTNFAHIATVKGHLLSLHSLAFSTTENRFASGSVGRDAIKIWDATTYLELATFPGTGSIFYFVSFSPDGNVIGALNQEGTLHLWQAQSSSEIQQSEQTRLTPHWRKAWKNGALVVQ